MPLFTSLLSNGRSLGIRVNVAVGRLGFDARCAILLLAAFLRLGCAPRAELHQLDVELGRVAGDIREACFQRRRDQLLTNCRTTASAAASPSDLRSGTLGASSAVMIPCATSFSSVCADLC